MLGFKKEKFIDILELIEVVNKRVKLKSLISYKGHTGNALALRGEEGRDKLR